MGQMDGDKEFPATSAINSLLNLHQIQSFPEIEPHGQTQMLPSSDFDPTVSHDDFIEQMLSSVPAAFSWPEDQQGLQAVGSLEEHPPPPPVLPQGVKMRHQHISSAEANSLMLQHQLLLSRGLDSISHDNRNDAVDGASFASANLPDDATVKALFDGFHGSLSPNSIPSQHFHQPQTQNYSAPPPGTAPLPATTAQPRQRVRVRARRGQATDPHSIAERLRRERIAERMKALQELVPNANKTDKASMLDEIIDYVKFLQLQAKVLSISRLGGAAAAVAPLVADKSLEGRGGGGAQTAAASSSSSSNDNEALAVMEQQVAKLMDEDIGAAMQYLQGKGLCLMPISLATAISTSTSTAHRNPLLSNANAGPSSPTASALTVQSVKDAAEKQKK